MITKVQRGEEVRRRGSARVARLGQRSEWLKRAQRGRRRRHALVVLERGGRHGLLGGAC